MRWIILCGFNLLVLGFLNAQKVTPSIRIPSGIQKEYVEYCLLRSHAFNSTNNDSAAYYAIRARTLSLKQADFTAFLSARLAETRALFYLRDMAAFEYRLAETKNWIHLWGDSTHWAHWYSLKAGWLSTQGHLIRSLGFYQQAYEIRKHTHDQYWLSRAAYNIAAVSRRIGLKEESLQAYRETLKIAESIQDSAAIARGWHGLGVWHWEFRTHLDSSEYYFKQAQAYNHRKGLLAEEASNLSGLAAVYFIQKKYERISDLYFRQIEIYNQTGNIHAQGQAFNNLGVLYLEQGERKKAVEWATKGLQVARDHQLVDNKLRAWAIFKRMALEQTHYKKALLYTDSIGAAQNRIQKEYNQKELQRLQQVHEYEKQQLAQKNTELLNSQKLKDEIQRATTRTNILHISLLFLSVLTLGAYIAYRIRRRAHKRETYKNAILKRQRKEIKYLNTHLEQLVQERTHALKLQNEKLAHYAQLNAHEVRGPLTTMLGLIQLHKEGLIDSKEEAESLFVAMEKSGKALDKVIHRINETLEKE